MRHPQTGQIQTLPLFRRDEHLNHLARIIMATLMSVSLLLLMSVNTVQAAEENPYTKHYKEQNTSNLKSMNPVPDTKILVSNHKDDDNISMLEDGYDMIGSSGFSATEASPDLALQHAKSIKADTVLVYKKYGSAKTASSQLQLIKEAAKEGRELDPNDLVEEPTQYNFYASYWAKLPMPLFGVHIIKLSKKSNTAVEDEESTLQMEPGLKIIAVIKDSPAAKAGIKRGDTLLKLADTTLESADDLFAAVKKHAGQTVHVSVERKGMPLSFSAALNARK